MPTFNQTLIDRISRDLSANKPVEEMIDYLVLETREPVEKTLINLNTLDQAKPNINPWNHLGISLLNAGKFEESEKVWRKIIELAYEQAPERYGNIPPVGLPYNNLSLCLHARGKHNDALIAILKAYEHDVRGNNPGNVARNNFDRMFSTVLAKSLEKITLVVPGPAQQRGQEKPKRDRMPGALAISGYSFLVWLSFLLPTIFGGIMLWRFPDNWYFLFLVVIGIISPYFYNKNIDMGFAGFKIKVDQKSDGEPQKQE
jgi:tetratricopeptide (TPR) repeat protein